MFPFYKRYVSFFFLIKEERYVSLLVLNINYKYTHSVFPFTDNNKQRYCLVQSQSLKFILVQPTVG